MQRKREPWGKVETDFESLGTPSLPRWRYSSFLRMMYSLAPSLSLFLDPFPPLLRFFRCNFLRASASARFFSYATVDGPP